MTGGDGPVSRDAALAYVPAPTRAGGPEVLWLAGAARARREGRACGPPPAHAVCRSDLGAVEGARDAVRRSLRERALEREHGEDEAARDPHGRLPAGPSGPLSVLTRGFALRPLTPWHQTSTGRAGVLTLLTAGCGSPRVPGPPLGVDVLTRELFEFDPWGAYDAGMVRSPDLFVSGLRGMGKSWCAKALAVREIGWGRHVIVQSDRQGEWARVARHVGGQVVSPGPDGYLNPFDAPACPAGADTREWLRRTMLSRRQSFASLAEALRDPGRPSPLDTDMTAMLELLIGSYGAGPMTLEDAVRRLSDTGWVDRVYQDAPGFARQRDLAAEKAAAAARVFAPMVAGGSMSGMFDRESTIRPDPSSPMVVFDTSGPAVQDPAARRVYMSAVTGWVDQVLQSGDGLRRDVVCEEAWFLLANPRIVESLQARQRSAGHWGCSTWLIVHGAADMTELFDEGSGQAGRVANLMDLTETKVTYAQGSANLGMLRRLIPDMGADEAEVIPSLAPGVGIWRIGGGQPRMVRPLAGPSMAALFDTSDMRRA